jgi:hypothetical protein
MGVDHHSRRDTRRGRLIRVGPNLAQNGKRLRRSGARHLCCRVQNGRGRGAGDFDSSHRVRGDPAFPRTHALRAVCAGFEQALTLPDLQDVEGHRRTTAQWVATAVSKSSRRLSAKGLRSRRMLPPSIGVRTEQERTGERGSAPSCSIPRGTEGGTPMWMKTSLIALGIASALAAATPTPTLALDVHVGPGGVGVDTGRHGWRHDRAYRGYGYERGFRGPGCRTVTIRRDDGSMKQIRRCD